MTTEAHYKVSTKNGTASELLTSDGFVDLDHLPGYLPVQRLYWHEWPLAGKPEIKVKLAEANFYASFGISLAKGLTYGRPVFAYIATVGPNAGKVGAVFMDPKTLAARSSKSH